MLEFLSKCTKSVQHLVSMAPMEIGGAQSKAGLFAQLSFAIICRDAIDEIEAAEVDLRSV